MIKKMLNVFLNRLMFKQITFVINLNIEPRSKVINFDFSRK